VICVNKDETSLTDQEI